jgi:aminoglycoside 3-N-acetyltransferase I
MNEIVIGGLTVYVLHRYYSEKPTAYVYDVGVSSEHQRKGAGKLLISHLVAYCQQNGFEDVFVQAEAADFETLNFYKNTGYDRWLDATQFTYYTNR